MEGSVNPLQLLRQEKELFAKHAVLRVRRTKLIERFHAELAELGEAEAQLLLSIRYVQGGIHEYRRQLEISRLPPELADLSSAPLVSSTARSDQHQAAAAAPEHLGLFEARCRADQPEDAESRSTFEGCIRAGTIKHGTSASTAAPSRLERVPPAVADVHVLSKHASVVYRHRDGRLLRRPASADFEIMRSPQASLGRVLVSRRAVPRGSTLFVETPFLVCRDVADVLPPIIEGARATILSKVDVFAKQRWDSRLVHPLMVYLASLYALSPADAGQMAAAQKQLCCPYDDIPPAELNAMCDFGSFLHAGLPASLASLASEDDVTKFLLQFQCNSINLSQQVDSSAALGVGAASMRAIVLFSSLVEHSCDPNALFVLRRDRSEGLVVEVRALRDVAIGERLSVAYIPLFASRSERQALLRRKYYFSCSCQACSGGYDCGRLFVIDLATGSSGKGQLCAPIADGATWRVFNWDGSLTSAGALAPVLLQQIVQVERKWSASLTATDETSEKLMLLLNEMLSPSATAEVSNAGSAPSVRLGCSHTLVVATILRLLKSLKDVSPTGEIEKSLQSVLLRACVELAMVCLGNGEASQHLQWLMTPASCRGSRLVTGASSETDAWAGTSAVPGTVAAGHLLATLLEVLAVRSASNDDEYASDVWYGLFLLLKYPLAQEYSERAVLAQINAKRRAE